MPLEIKKIYFTESELRIALINFSVKRKRYLELSDIKKMLVNKTDQVQITFLLDQALALEDYKVTFSHAEVAAALLALSMMCKIPLPRTGTKELRATKDKIYLQITYNKTEKFNEYGKDETLKDGKAFLIQP